jgi:16S rRNA (uracil1498-N3)-methyltransferase
VQVQLLPPGARTSGAIYLEGPEAHHIVSVLRHRTGDVVVFADGRGRFVQARIDRCSARAVHAIVEGSQPDPREQGAPWLTLALALLKGDHFDLAVEKAVELGVHRIVPISTERCVVRLDEKSGSNRQQRWQRIAQSAMKQSGRSWLPEVESAVPLSALGERVPASATWIVGDEEEATTRVAQVLSSSPAQVVALIGPEGGLSPAEKQLLAQRGARAVTLCGFRLRAETAAIALLSQIVAAVAAP